MVAELKAELLELRLAASHAPPAHALSRTSAATQASREEEVLARRLEEDRLQARDAHVKELEAQLAQLAQQRGLLAEKASLDERLQARDAHIKELEAQLLKQRDSASRAGENAIALQSTEQHQSAKRIAELDAKLSEEQLLRRQAEGDLTRSRADFARYKEETDAEVSQLRSQVTKPMVEIAAQAKEEGRKCAQVAISALMDQLEEKDSLKAELEFCLKDAEARCAHLQAKLYQVTRKAAEDIQAREVEKAAVEQAHGEIEAKLEASTAEASMALKVSEEKAALFESKLRQRQADAEADASGSSDRIAELEQELAKQKEEAAAAMRKASDEARQHLQDIVEPLQEQLKVRDAEIDKSSEAITELEAKVASVKQHAGAMEEAATKARVGSDTRVSECHSKQMELTLELSRLRSSSTDTNADLQHAVARAKELEEQITHQRQQIEGLEVQLSRAKAEATTRLDSAESLVAEVKRQQAIVADLEEQLANQMLSAQVALSKAQAEEEQRRRADEAKAKEVQRMLEEQRRAKSVEAEAGANEISSLRARLSDQQALLLAARSEADQRVKILEAQIEELRAMLAQQRHAATDEAKSSTSRITELEARLAKQQALIQDALFKSKQEGQANLHVSSVKSKALYQQLSSLQATIAEESKSMKSISAKVFPPVAAEDLCSSPGGIAWDEEPTGEGREPWAQSKLVESKAGTRAAMPRGVASPADLELRGLSVHYLSTALLQEVGAAGLESRTASLRDLEAAVVLPHTRSARCQRDGEMGAAYVDLLWGDDHAGRATHLLSCPPQAPIGEVAEALAQYCREAGLPTRRTYVWICCMCNNQHRGRPSAPGDSGASPEVDVGELREKIESRMRSIGKVLALVTPWNSPQYLKSPRCLAEMCIALPLGAERCEFTMVMPPAGSAQLARELARIGGAAVAGAWSTMGDMHVEGAPGQEDYAKLLAEGIGLPAVQAMVTRQMQTWLITACEGSVRRLLASGELDGEPAAGLCDLLGWLLREVGLFHRATAMLQDGLQLALHVSSRSATASGCFLSSMGTAKGSSSDQEAPLQALDAARRTHERQGTLETPAGVAVLLSIGAARWMSGDQEGALEALVEVRRIRADTHALETAEGAVVLRNIGVVKWAKGDHEGGLEAYLEARRVRELTGSLHTPEGVVLLLNIGFARADRGDSSGALEAYEQARHLYEALATLETPSCATLLTSMGVALGNRGDQAAAARAYASARRVRETTGTLESSAGAVLLRNVGVALAATGAPGKALEAYAEARRLREQMGTLHTAAGANLLSNIGVARAECGDRRGALEAMRKAKRVYESTGTVHTPNGKMLLKHLASLESA